MNCMANVDNPGNDNHLSFLPLPSRSGNGRGRNYSLGQRFHGADNCGCTELYSFIHQTSWTSCHHPNPEIQCNDRRVGRISYAMLEASVLFIHLSADGSAGTFFRGHYFPVSRTANN